MTISRACVYHYFINVRQKSRMKDIEREMVMTIKCAWLGVENEAGVKEPRVSRVTIRFRTAVVSAGSWALSICNSLYGVRDVCTILHRTRECNTYHFKLHDCWWKKKRWTRESSELSKHWCVLYSLLLLPSKMSPLQGRVENSSISSRGYSLADDIPRVAENGIFI